MAQIFHRATNALSRATIFGGVFILAALVFVLGLIARSPWATEVGVPIEQPVPFSHRHHVGDDGIDCRYCHTTVEESPFAGMPSTQTCLNCHQYLWNEAPVLAPVRESWRTDRPIAWTRVNNLPDFVYFEHSIHVAMGIGCSTCHGRVDEMPLMWKAVSLHMEWCLECHRHPERFVRPRAEVFNMEWQIPPDQDRRGPALVAEYGISVKTSCSTCHR